MTNTKDIQILDEDYLTDEELAWEDEDTKELIRAAERGELISVTDPKVL